MNLSFLLLFVLVLVGRGVGLNECQESRCGKHGPPIRFPFRLKNRQPEFCGFPGFDLSCTETQDTLLELPTSVKLYINTIDYASQVIFASDPNNCLPRQLLNFNLSNSPFKFGERFQYDYVFFNLALPLHLVRRCITFHQFPWNSSAETILHLKWSKPACGFCEAQDKYCRLKNSTRFETECFDKPKSSRGIGIKLMAAGELAIYLLNCHLKLCYIASAN
ncbi:hypothetical protein GH714_028290 [Hevea brasiliensis]|uniref:RING-type E3 ubiquitin transferase n=1 Tax=Hevea brasiliensis TaxID=3981 RepID=A0A6A6MID4_HEVBR|nr:hypothetical protein GH714_028290 [Hevea brasiliensis]